MAISIQDKRLVITAGQATGYDMAYIQIVTLLNMMQSITEDDRISTADIYYTCEMIHNLLPTIDDFAEIERLRKK